MATGGRQDFPAPADAPDSPRIGVDQWVADCWHRSYGGAPYLYEYQGW